MSLPQIPSLTPDTTRKPEKLYEFLRLFSDAVRKLDVNPDAPPEVFELTPNLLSEIRAALQVDGSVPLNVNGLLGLLSQPQTAALVIASTLPNAANYLPGTMLILTGSPDTFYYCKSGSPNTWQSISTTPLNMMTTDTPQTVLAAAVKTVQASWVFEVNQTARHALDAALIWLVENTNAVGTAASAIMRVGDTLGNLGMIAHGAGRTLVRCGITMGGWNELLANSGNGLLIDTIGVLPIVVGTNGVERARFSGAGGATGWALTVGQLIQMVGAIAANTTQFEILKSSTDGGASVFKVDYEGDTTLNALLAVSAKITSPAADALLIQPSSASGGAKLFVIKNTGGTEAVAMRDSGQVNLTGAGAQVSADNSIGGAVVFEVKQSGVQKAAIDSDGWIDGTALTVGGGTKITKIATYSPTLSPAAVAANTTAEQTFAVAGLTTSDIICAVNKPTAQAGLGIVGMRVSSAGNIGITFSNNTGASITPTASETYKIVAIRS